MQEQSGFFAGKDGFHIDVDKHTQLNGGVIVSTDSNDANRLSTNTLGTSSITNRSEYAIEQSSISLSTGGNTGGIGGGHAEDSDKTSNITYSALSPAAVEIRSGDDSALAEIKSSTEEAHRILENNFNPDKIQEVQDEAELQQLLSTEAPKLIGDFADKQLQESNALYAQAAKETNPERKASLRARAQAIEEKWGESGDYRVALHTLTGVASGGLQGGLGSLAVASTIEQFNTVLESADIDDGLRKSLLLASSAVIGGVANGTTGAVNTLGQTSNNFLKHEEQRQYATELAACNDEQCVNRINDEYKTLSLQNNEQLERLNEQCQAGNGGCQERDKLIAQGLSDRSQFSLNEAKLRDFTHSPNFFEPSPETVAQTQQKAIDKVIKRLTQQTLDDEIVIIPQHQTGNDGRLQPTRFVSAIDQDNGLTQGAIVVSSLALPDPTDFAVGAFLFTKTGQAIGKVIEKEGEKVVEFANGAIGRAGDAIADRFKRGDSGRSNGGAGTDTGTNTPTNNQVVPDRVTRQDNDFSSTINHKNQKKSYIDENGTLTPANPDGNITIQQHVRGADPAKGNSQYTSTTAVDDNITATPKDFGKDTIEIDTKRLQQDIEAGKIDGVEIIPPKKVRAELESKIDEAQARFDANPSPNNAKKLQRAKKDLENATRDNECLIKGCVPSDYIQGGN